MLSKFNCNYKWIKITLACGQAVIKEIIDSKMTGPPGSDHVNFKRRDVLASMSPISVGGVALQKKNGKGRSFS